MNDAADIKERRATARMVSARLTDARDLCQHNITQASWLLGITPSELRTFETGHGFDGEPLEIPLWLIVKASQIYAVSCDFLLGTAPINWELEPDSRKDRDLCAMLNVMHFNESRRVAKLIFRQDGRLQAVEKVVGTLPLAVKEISEALAKYRELNPNFDNTHGGASLVVRIEKAAVIAHQSTCLLARHKCIPKEQLYQLNPDPIQELKPPKPKTQKLPRLRQAKVEANLAGLMDAFFV